MRTCSISETRNPDFLFSHHFTMNPVTEQFLDYLIGTPLIVEVWGKQVQAGGRWGGEGSTGVSGDQVVGGEVELDQVVGVGGTGGWWGVRGS